MMMLVAALSLGGVFAVAAPAGAANNLTCSGGPIAPGVYGSVTVTGFCFALSGDYMISGGLTVAPNALLDATNCDSHVTVYGGVRVLTGAVLALGGSVNGSGCEADTNDHIRGGIQASGAVAVILHGIVIENGGLSVRGGGGGNSYFGTGDEADCALYPGLPFPPFSNVEDSVINGGVSFSNLHTCWMGIIRVQINNSGLIVNNNVLGDPDAIEIGDNVINGGMACSGNVRDPASPILPLPPTGGVPTNFFDGTGPHPNVVAGGKTGQCAGL